MTGRRRTLRRIGRRADATDPRRPERHTPDTRTPDRTDVDVSRVRAILALGGVPWGDLDDGVQEVRLKLLEQRADPARAAVRDTSAWSSVVASRVAADWHRAGARDDGLLDIPEGTVKSRLHTAVAALRTRLRETEVIHGDRTDRD
ncbi:RNA polymerase subunit sigma-70 [Streptomyces endocoffeicus]|uniref:RNA polymerase subunit sigma-70 n=1 Tax=Streptomyces endocoffeicus TaxID=2898945 RepID=UPI001E3F56EF|nr:RNA polymerase subunit sigma-70 [Streptomyces endocoffeicus]